MPVRSGCCILADHSDGYFWSGRYGADGNGMLMPKGSLVLEELRNKAHLVMDEVKKVIMGKDDCVEKVMAAILAGGNVLLEDGHRLFQGLRA